MAAFYSGFLGVREVTFNPANLNRGSGQIQSLLWYYSLFIDMLTQFPLYCMNFIQRMPKGLLAFLTGLSICLGASQIAGFVIVPFVLIGWFFTIDADKSKVVTLVPILSFLGLICSFVAAYISFQFNSEKWFRRGVVVAVILSVLQMIGRFG